MLELRFKKIENRLDSTPEYTSQLTEELNAYLVPGAPRTYMKLFLDNLEKNTQIYTLKSDTTNLGFVIIEYSIIREIGLLEESSVLKMSDDEMRKFIGKYKGSSL